jgi:hypothetical protein
MRPSQPSFGAVLPLKGERAVKGETARSIGVGVFIRGNRSFSLSLPVNVDEMDGLYQVQNSSYFYRAFSARYPLLPPADHT